MKDDKPVISAQTGAAIQAAAMAAQTIAVAGNLPREATPWVMFGASVLQAFVGVLSGCVTKQKKVE